MKLTIHASYVKDLSMVNRYSMDVGTYLNWFVGIHHAMLPLSLSYNDVPGDILTLIRSDLFTVSTLWLGRFSMTSL